VHEVNLKSKKRLLAIFGTSCVLLISGYWLAQLYLGPTVGGYRVSRERLVQTVMAEGVVSLPENITVSSRTSGKVAAINVTVGQAVKAGQTLISLENKSDRAAIEKARAEIVRAEARFRKISEMTQAGSRESVQRAKNGLEIAQKQAVRINALSSKGFVGDEQKSDALRNLANRQSQLSTAMFQAKANRAKGSDYALAELALNKARAQERKARAGSAVHFISAEVDGVVLSCNLAKGNLIKPHKTLLILSPAGKAQVLARLDRKIIPDIKLGQPASVIAYTHPGLNFNAEIIQIDSVPDIIQDKVAVKFNIVKAPDFLAQNLPVKLEIELMRKTATLSLAAADIRNADSAEPWVMVAENGRTQRKMIKLGLRGNGKVEVVQGLHEGDFVIPVATFEIEAGKRVQLARN
jgi:HlyD family secretion protein